jgi:hypothetical protein
MTRRSSTPIALALSLALPLGLGAQERYDARKEAVPDFTVFAEASPSARAQSAVGLERVTTAVPWPRGMVVVDGEMIVLARGRHRNAGGIDPDIPDDSGTLFAVDLDVFEPVHRGEEAGEEVRRNARRFVLPDPDAFHLYDPDAGEPITQTLLDRPYCTLAWDPVSRNFFICGYSGIDLPKRKFRKNATDSILRYDMRTSKWLIVEQHDPSVVPESELGYVVPNHYYPHHEPENPVVPHGWLNGPDGACVAGEYLYAVGKDNHRIASYDLAEIRRDPGAPPPDSRVVLESTTALRLDGEVRTVELMGHSALAVNDGYLYVGYRTSSVVVRFPLEADGSLVEPLVAELVAVFEPWDAERKRSGNLIDIKFNSRGELFVACAKEGRIWNVGVPDPEAVFHGNDQADPPCPNEPYADLRVLTGNPKANVGNIAFDDQDRLYICSGNYDSGTRLAGVIYRAVVGE